MAIYLTIHDNEYGTDTKLVRVPDTVELDSAFAFLDEERQVELAAVLGIDFEPAKSETLTITFIDLDRVDEYGLADLAAFVRETD